MTIPLRPAGPAERVPPLENGDLLTRAEFERRYLAMSRLKKAELLQGAVHVPSPVTWADHAVPHADVIWLLKHYSIFTPGVSVGDNGTVRLETDSEPQPDVTVIVSPAHGGRVQIDADGYVAGAPDLVAEVSATSVSIDLGKKLDVYRRNQVSEYLVWRVYDEAVDWFVLRDGQFDRLPLGEDGLIRSEVFPGLWLDPAALVRGDLAAVLAALSRGLASAEHAAFVQRLRAARTPPT